MATDRARRGVTLGPDQFDFQLGRRGITARDLARQTGLVESVISRARNGKEIRARTLRRITQGLLAFPVLAGSDDLFDETSPKHADGNGHAPSSSDKGSSHAAPVKTKRRAKRVA